jgi:ribosome maturation factor RimP
LDVKCFITIFIHAEDGTRGLKHTQNIAEETLSKRGFSVEGVKAAENARRVTIYTTIKSKQGETSQQAIDRVAKEITEATERTAVGRPEGWSARKH